MPASLAWSSPPRAPIFQVYGTKRKAESDVGMDYDQQAGDLVKRHCQGGNDQQAIDHAKLQCHGGDDQAMQQDNTTQPMQQQSPAKTWCSQVQNQQVHRSPSPWPDAPPVQPQQQPQQQQQSQQQPQQQPQQQQQQIQPQPQPTQYIMNINDEVYSDLSMGSMDSDFVPNQSQYFNQVGPAGDASTSDLARCYCRPSWDGLIALKPYVSDYY